MSIDGASSIGTSGDAGAESQPTLADCAARVARNLALFARAEAARGRSQLLHDQLRDTTRESSVVIAQATELRAAVSAQVDRMRSSGAPPEQVLVAIKGAVGRAAHAALSQRDADALIDATTRWTIDAYYAA
jgi:hypothetical protein